MLNDAVKQSLKESVLCWLATADKNGIPNVSPKEMFVSYGDDLLLVANIASPQSVNNIRQNRNVCVSFVHIFKQKGYKIEGLANNLEPTDENFDKYQDALYSQGGREFVILSVVAITVTNISPIVAPSYILYPKVTESEQVNQALKTYGVSSLVQ